MKTKTEKHQSGMCEIEVGTIELEGREFSALGSVVCPDYLAAYLSKDNELTTWEGEVIGTWRKVASWRIPNGVWSNEMWQVEAIVEGRVFTGRSMGEGMLYRGKPKKT